MRLFESALKVDGWQIRFPTVQRFLDHYSQKTRSESTKENNLSSLDAFLKFHGQIASRLGKGEALKIRSQHYHHCQYSCSVWIEKEDGE
jgi:hypothetical protein